MTAPSSPPAASSPALPVAILVVDDEEAIRSALKRFLLGQGYEVVTAATGAEAVQAVQRHKLACVLLDVRLPDASGVDLVRWIRSYEQGQERFTVVIALTRAPEEYPVDMARAVGFDAYFTRPPTTDDLTVALAALMSAHRTRRSAA